MKKADLSINKLCIVKTMSFCNICLLRLKDRTLNKREPDIRTSQLCASNSHFYISWTLILNAAIYHQTLKQKHESCSHGCGLASTIVSQERDHLVFMEVQAQFVESEFAAKFVHFGQFVYAHH